MRISDWSSDVCSSDLRNFRITKIAIIVGSTRPGRLGAAVAEWVNQVASRRTDAEFEIVDIADFALPLLDEPLPASMGQYANEHTKVWAAKIAPFDGFVFVAPEYNHGISGGLKNAVDYLSGDWTHGKELCRVKEVYVVEH